MAAARDSVHVDILAETKKGIASMAKYAAAVGVAFIAVRGMKKVVSDLIQTYSVQEKAEAKLASVLKSTGNAVGITKDEMIEYAKEMQNLTTYGDEAIIAAEGLMTTFTKIGKDVFPTAIEAAADMSTMFGQDLQQSVIQLGTALNDPIAGIGRLRRIGISFTEEQKDMIKGFVEANDIMSAQEVILKELNVEFGGVAFAMGETATGALIQFNNALGDLKEVGGEAVVKGIQPLVEWLTEVVAKAAASAKEIEAIDKAIKQMTEVGMAAVEDKAALIKDFENKWDELNKAIKESGDVTVQTAREMLLYEKYTEDMAKAGATTWEELRAYYGAQRGLLQDIIREEENLRIAKAAADAEAEKIAARNLADAKARKEQIDKINEAYGKTPGAIKENLAAEIALFEYLLPKYKEYEEHIEAILEMLRKQIPVQKEIINGINNTSTAYQDQIGVVKDLNDFLGETWDEMMERIKDAADKMTETMEPFTDAFGAMILDAAKGWDLLKQAAKNAIADILKMLAKEAFAKAFLNWANPAAAAGYTAAGTAAMVAAGVVKAMQEGGVTTQMTPALLHPNEAVIPLDRASKQGKLGGLGTTIHVYVAGSVIREEALARQIGGVLARDYRGY